MPNIFPYQFKALLKQRQSKPVSVEKSKLIDDDDEDYNFDDVSADLNNGGRPQRKAARKAKTAHDSDDDMNMYVDGDDNDSLMEIEDPGNDSEFDEAGGERKKRAAATRKPKEGVNGKKKRWDDAFDEEGNDNEEKKKMRQLKKE